MQQFYDAYGRPCYPQAVPDQLGQIRQQRQMMQRPDPGILWVQGEAGAKSFMVGQNQSVVLMDSENDVFYIKTVDNIGMPSLRVFDYKERTAAKATPQAANLNEEFLTRREFMAFLDKLQGVEHEPKFAKEE